jgi:transcriptional regulator with XRE-family HTH domain
MVKLKSTNLNVLGERIRHYRKERGWNQEEFAYKCGLDRSYVGGIERGERNITFETLCAIADGLGMSLPDLLAGMPRRRR